MTNRTDFLNSDDTVFYTSQKLFGYKMAEFRVTIENVWSNDGAFETIETSTNRLTPTKVKGKYNQTF